MWIFDIILDFFLIARAWKSSSWCFVFTFFLSAISFIIFSPKLLFISRDSIGIGWFICSTIFSNVILVDSRFSTQPPQQNSHKFRQNCHQTNTIQPQHTTTSLSNPIPQLFHQQISPDIINLILQRSNQATSQKRHRR